MPVLYSVKKYCLPVTVVDVVFVSMKYSCVSADICTMNSLGMQTNCNDIPFDAKGILPSDFVGISELNFNQPKELIKIVNLLGQEVEYTPNTVLIYQYSDGTSEKVFTIED